MGKSLPSTTRVNELIRIVSSSDKLLNPKRHSIPNPKANTKLKPNLSPQIRVIAQVNNSDGNRVIPEQNRVPLSVAVADCVKVWFKETLKEAEDGNSSMQLLVGQMYYSGYGVTQDPIKGRFWIDKASARRGPAWKVFDKHPGYGISDSDSEEVKDSTINLKE